MDYLKELKDAIKPKDATDHYIDKIKEVASLKVKLELEQNEVIKRGENYNQLMYFIGAMGFSYEDVQDWIKENEYVSDDVDD